MIVAVIPAKGESTRLSDKNLMQIGGGPLVVHAIRYAQRAVRIDQIFVSTDSDDIAALAERSGTSVIRRSQELGGEAPLMDVYRHAWKFLGPEKVSYMIGVQPDHPGRRSDPDRVIEYVTANGIDDLFTVDRRGKRNGALRVMSERALRGDPSGITYSLMDDCVNVHTHADFVMAAHEMSSGSQEIAVAGKMIGEGHPVFVIAEAACNHMCDIDVAQQMIDGASEAGAGAIKFQTYKAERLVRREAKLYWAGEETSQIEYYQRLDRFGLAEYERLFAYARARNIIAFSTPFDLESAAMLNDLGMPLFKIASCDLPDTRLLRRVARFGKPLILSTGGSTPEEIGGAVTTILETGNHQLVLMACMLSYPTANEDANLMRIRALKERYPSVIIGLSDHTEPDAHMVIPALGATLGAKIIEKHYTLDRSLTGSGHFFAVTLEDLTKMIANIRLAERVWGEARLAIAPGEEVPRASARRSIVAERLIRRGEVIESSMLGMKRPGDGLPGWQIDQVIGRRAKQDIEADQGLSLDMLE